MFLISLNYFKPIATVERILLEHRAFLNKYNKYYDNGNFIREGESKQHTFSFFMLKI